MRPKAQLRGNRRSGLSGDFDATTIRGIAEAVVFTDQFIPFDQTHAQRNASMQAKIARGADQSATCPPKHKPFIQQQYRQRFFLEVMSESHWMPIWREHAPVGLGEAAFGWQRKRFRLTSQRFASLYLDKYNDGQRPVASLLEAHPLGLLTQIKPPTAT